MYLILALVYQKYLKQLIERKPPTSKSKVDPYTLPVLIDPESGQLISTGKDEELKFIYKINHKSQESYILNFNGPQIGCNIS